MRKALLFFGTLTILVVGFVTCTFEVAEDEFAIVARFGDPSREISESGLQFKLPSPIDRVTKIDRRLHILDPEPAEYLTADKKNILVSCFLVWRVVEPRKFLVSSTSQIATEARLTDIMRSEVGTILGSHPLSVLVSDQPSERTMSDVMAEVTGRAAVKARENFGIEVSSVRIKRLNFPTQNKQAVFRRMEAERQRIARLYRSEGEEEAQKIRSKANRDQAVLINEATRSAEETRGAGDAEAIRILNEAHGQNREFYEFLRSLEALENTVQNNSTFVIPSDWQLLDVLRDPDGKILDSSKESGSGGTKE